MEMISKMRLVLEVIFSNSVCDASRHTLKVMNRSPRRGTLASIAAELGVSRTTVSNAYNRPDQLSPELRDKIFATAMRIGYPGPDPTARSLRTRRAGAVGVVLTEELTYAFEDQASVDFMAGVSESCGDMGVSMLLIPAGRDTATHTPTHLINQASVDGFIVYSVASDDPFLTAVSSRGLPTVICDQPATEKGLPFVGIDDREAIKPVVRQLVDAGHRRVGILCIRLDRTPNNGPVAPSRLNRAHMHVQRSRVLGALDVLEGAGIPRDEVPVVERHVNDPDNTYSAAEELLTTHPDLTAVVCTTDSMAVGVHTYAHDRGLQLPRDLSVTGFDGIPRALHHGITTVTQPSREKGSRSGAVLAALIAGENPRTPERIILDTHVVTGRTVGPPAR